MTFLNIFQTTLPIQDPVLEFLIILIIILFAPLLLNKLKIPHLLGLIIAGAVIGPNGFNLLDRDSSIVLSGTAGLLYIMFLAGLEIDLAEFKKNSSKSIVFGLYTFIIPMALGSITGYYLLNFEIKTALLWASMFASHTLIAYPLVSKLGVARNRAVNITVGGTMITDILALLILAVIVGLTTGEVNTLFWVRLSVSVILFGLVVLLVFPIVGRWFFKQVEDNVSQYIFVLVMVYLGAILAEMAGIEAIIGAFLTGLALNRLIPHTSPLMNRVEFVGNAIFIPFFLIGVGMLIDYRAFFKDLETLKIAGIMVAIATLSKFTAAWLTQKSFKFTVDERRLIFGLSNAQAAATLAAVLVGYNIIIGTSETGDPIRLLSESILNGTIIMILFTCTIASFVAQKGARNLLLMEGLQSVDEEEKSQEVILLPVNSLEVADNAVSLALLIKSKNNQDGILATNIVDNTSTNTSSGKLAQKILKKAAITASAADYNIQELLRYDINLINGLISTVKENQITDLIFSLQPEKGLSETFLNKLNQGILPKCNAMILLHKPSQPLATIKRHLVFIPRNAEKEFGFPFWLIKIWNIAKNSGARIVFYAPSEIQTILKDIQVKHAIECEYKDFKDWKDYREIRNEIKTDDNSIIILSRKNKVSYQEEMSKIPAFLNEHFVDHSYLVIYPLQLGLKDTFQNDLKNTSLVEPLEKLESIRKSIFKFFGDKV
ncbi:MAG: cation:proton antiporter [Bacteroidetes bacterium]|nr:cation:proton antiporter [Bacteroidota bacterium]